MSRIQGVEHQPRATPLQLMPTCSADSTGHKSWGRTAPEVAQALGIHPQTARNRLRRLDALFGDRLGDPRFRGEALWALRTHALRPNAG